MSERYRIRRLGTSLVVAEFATARELREGEALDRLADEIKANRLPANRGYELQWSDLRLHRWTTVATTEP